MPEVFEFADQKTDKAIIKVIGVGGGGGNTINQMVNGGIEGVDFICANTDAQHLERCDADVLVQLGMNVTRGLGAGADPAIGRQAAEEDRDRIRESIEGADMLFITAGMGGGTGTGAAPVVAEIAREMGILTLAVVTKPFPFERGRRHRRVDFRRARCRIHDPQIGSIDIEYRRCAAIDQTYEDRQLLSHQQRGEGNAEYQSEELLTISRQHPDRDPVHGCGTLFAPRLLAGGKPRCFMLKQGGRLDPQVRRA